jgi:hypothetical protein
MAFGSDNSDSRKILEFFQTKPQYSILETVLIEAPNFNNLDLLSQEIEDKLILVSDEIIKDIKRSKLK